jgi:hypothetical protein
MCYLEVVYSSIWVEPVNKVDFGGGFFMSPAQHLNVSKRCDVIYIEKTKHRYIPLKKSGNNSFFMQQNHII